MSKFWILYNSRLWSSNIYYSREAAEKAKIELERCNPDVKFIIMVNVDELNTTK